VRTPISYNDNGKYRHTMRKLDTPRWWHYAIAKGGTSLRPITLTACGREVDSRTYTTDKPDRVTCKRCMEELQILAINQLPVENLNE
jgi:hypothetical protein